MTASRAHAVARAFTLIELLVVVAIISMLIGLLLPALGRARESGRGVVCLSNQRQLAVALLTYGGDHDDHAMPGARDFRANLHRWHGSRASTGERFTPDGAPISPYLSGGPASEAVRVCPTFAGTLRALESSGLGFERSAGGYGYNNAYLGVRLASAGQDRWAVRDDRTGSRLTRFAQPSGTIAFGDTAFPDGRAPDRLIEYSFVEPRFHPLYGEGGYRMDPSMHFRHGPSLAAVTWLDGHVGMAKMTFSWSSGLYDPEPATVSIGWSGRDDSNGLFDFKAGGR